MSPRPKSSPTAVAPTGGERLQKVLAAAGLGSRRQCEELIVEGRVEVDRQVIAELGAKVDPQQHEIRVDGEVLRQPRLAYYMLHKPQGVISTARDPSGRPRVTDLVPPDLGRLFPVGRLDMSSEGLMLLTNDGELANQLMHPRYGVEKTYLVVVAGDVGPEVATKLLQGVRLAEGVARAVGVKIKSHKSKSSTLEIVLDEGRNREIRRLLAKLDHKVLRLTRIAIGPLRMGELPEGAYRPLTHEEISKLQQAAGGAPRKKKAATKRKPSARSAKQSTAAKPARPQQPQGRTVIGGVESSGAAAGGERSVARPDKRKQRTAAGKKQVGLGRPTTKKQAAGPPRGKKAAVKKKFGGRGRRP